MDTRPHARQPWRLGIALALAVAAGIAASPAPAPSNGPVLIQDGFGTGQTFRELSESERRAYAIGAINGMGLSPLFGAPRDRLLWLETCTTNMTDEQAAAILSKYFRDHPERWHNGLNVESFRAMKEACAAR